MLGILIGISGVIFGIYSLYIYPHKSHLFYNQLMWTLVVLMWIMNSFK